MEKEILVEAALRGGACKAAVIPDTQIVTSPEFRKICESNQCGGYGRCWMCPPHIGPVEELIQQVHSYPFGLLYQTIYPLEDSFDIEGMFEAGAKHAQTSQIVEQEMQKLLKAPFLHLSCGGCHLCEKCAILDQEPCRFPDKALSSLEGYGIDVYKTTEHTELKYINGQNTVTYFGIVLFTE